MITVHGEKSLNNPSPFLTPLPTSTKLGPREIRTFTESPTSQLPNTSSVLIRAREMAHLFRQQMATFLIPLKPYLIPTYPSPASHSVPIFSISDTKMITEHGGKSLNNHSPFLTPLPTSINPVRQEITAFSEFPTLRQPNTSSVLIRAKEMPQPYHPQMETFLILLKLSSTPTSPSQTSHSVPTSSISGIKMITAHGARY